MDEIKDNKEQQESKDKERSRSYRFKNNTVETFTTIAKDFKSQDEAMNALMETYQREKMKEEIPERSSEVSKFQEYLGVLLSRYVSSVKEAKSADERAKAEVSELLSSKDEVIVSLQQTNKELQEKMELNQRWRKDAEDAAAQAKREVEEQLKIVKGLNAEYDDLEKRSQETIKDKEKVIDVLGKKVDEMESKIADYSNLLAKIKELEEAGRKIEKNLQEAERSKKDMEYSHNMEMLKMESSHECELSKINAEREAALRVAGEEAQKALKELRTEKEQQIQEKQEKIDLLQQRIERLIENKNQKTEAMDD